MKNRTALRQEKIAFLAAHRSLWENHTGQDHQEVLERLATMLKRAGLYSRATKESDIVPGLRRLLQKARDVRLGEARTPAPAAPCTHLNWAVREYNRLGFGQCLDCRKELPLAALFQGLSRQAAEVVARQGLLVPPG